MRLVDAEEIVKRCEDVIRHGVADNAGQHHISAECVMSVVKALPTVDAVPVVRCKNCIHWGKFPVSTVLPQYHKCGMATYKSTKDDDFCSDGKDDDNG